ncbi:MAG: 16S rRNA (guanine(527)-N(7))-methyltransferase RsmG [Clostridia bacterium]|nr:16S rRNA (guanine(527)-N(7))-methyltransferase RsmG [Clostridia bacterium]
MDLQSFSASFVRIFARNGLDAYTDQRMIDAFFRLTERMLAVNDYMNLTAITEQDAVILRHYADSLTAIPYLPQGARVVDIGCGAGFPSLPLAIARPDLQILALDSTAKRIQYVSETAKMLGLTNLTAVSCRAEDGAAVGGAYRESFDCAVSRAVANLPVLCELCLPYVRVGGRFVAMKASQAMQETSVSHRAIETLGGKLVDVVSSELKTEDGVEERNLVLIEKIGRTPKNYPRNYAQIKKKPL